MLYLIPFLHQTTTSRCYTYRYRMLYLIPFLHQTTTENRHDRRHASCILFHFYIKPQPRRNRTSPRSVVSYSISTSNHNFSLIYKNFALVVSYSISTSNHNGADEVTALIEVVSYSISTSNHNHHIFVIFIILLYLIPFLHQTTTYGA